MEYMSPVFISGPLLGRKWRKGRGRSTPMRTVVPVIALLATTAGAVAAGMALRAARDPSGPRSVEAGVTRCTSDARCTFEDAQGTLSPARSTVSPE
jgi:hypothetical protein